MTKPDHSGTPARDLQERTARALPAAHLGFRDGWWLRHSPGCAWWISSVLPHGGTGSDDLHRRVDAAEAYHARRGNPVRIQITPGANADELDALLAARGYRVHSPVSLLTAPTALVGAATTPGPYQVRIDDHPAADWLALWHAENGGDAGAERRLLDRVIPPSGYARVTLGSDLVAIGRTVVDDGWAGVFGMVTRPGARGRGAAGAALAGLAGWAGTHGARHLYLQAERHNTAAWRRYERAGFRELCAYHYRTT